MESIDVAKLKSIGNDTKYLVFAFIHECELLFDKDNSYYNIPDLVGYICLAYYYISEYFTVYGDHITYDALTNTVENDSKLWSEIQKSLDEDDLDPWNKTQPHQTAYGNVCIDVDNNAISVYIWTFKIICCDTSICIGIESSNKRFASYDFTDVDRDAVDANVRFFAHGEGNGWTSLKRFPVEKGDDIEFVDGDIIKFTLNMKFKEIIIVKESENEKITYTLPDEFFDGCIFNLAVMLYSIGDSVQIVDFESH